MAVDAYKAAAAYAEAARAATGAARADLASESMRPDFGAMVADAISESAGALKVGETAALQVASGDAALVDVVTAISAAEVALETAISVRNRVIEAYQEVMRMPI